MPLTRSLVFKFDDFGDFESIFDELVTNKVSVVTGPGGRALEGLKSIIVSAPTEIALPFYLKLGFRRLAGQLRMPLLGYEDEFSSETSGETAAKSASSNGKALHDVGRSAFRNFKFSGIFRNFKFSGPVREHSVPPKSTAGVQQLMQELARQENENIAS